MSLRCRPRVEPGKAAGDAAVNTSQSLRIRVDRVDTALIIIILLSTFIGAAAQRIAGLGFALLIAPVFALLLGPHQGVLMVNICGVVSSAIIMSRVRRDIDWSMYRWLTVHSLLGSIPGAVAATYLPAAPLSILVGGIVLVALSLSLILQRTPLVVRGNGPKAAAGFLSGLTNAMAGVGGPAVSAYAMLTHWPQRPFAATLQPFFVTIGVVAIATKLVVAPGQAPSFGWPVWAGIGVLILAGIFAGERLQRHIKDDHARLIVIVIAFIGAGSALVKGLLEI